MESPGLPAGHGSHRSSSSLDGAGPRRGEVVVVQVHVGQEMTQGVPALGRRQAYQGGVTSLGEHSRHRRLAGLGCVDRRRILVFPGRKQWWWRGSEWGRLQIGAPPRVSQDLTVGRRRILHQNCLLIARRLPKYICVWKKERRLGSITKYTKKLASQPCCQFVLEANSNSS